MYRSPLAAALHLVDEPAEADQRLLHLLVAVVPLLLRRRPEVVAPAVGQLLRRVVQPRVGLAGHHVVVDGRLDEVARDVAFVVAAPLGGPALGPARRVAQRERGLEIAVRLLRGQDLRNPVLERRAHLRVRREDLGVALRIDHERDAHRLDRLVHPGVREDVALVGAVRLPGQRLGRLDEVVDAARAQLEVGAVDLVDAVRDPVHDQRLDGPVPERAVDPVAPGVDRQQVDQLRLGHDLHVQRRVDAASRRCRPSASAGRRRAPRTSAVVTGAVASANVTAPGPDTLLQAAFGGGPGGSGGGVGGAPGAGRRGWRRGGGP